MLMLYEKIRGQRLYYRCWGSGEDRVLLLHGCLVPSVLYEEVGPLLAAPGRRVIAPDFPGFGSSDKPTREYGLEPLYDDLLEIVLRFGGEGRLHLVAHDTAAVVACRLALEGKVEVASLALVDAWLAGDRERLPEVIEAAAGLGWRLRLNELALSAQARNLVQDPALLPAEARSALIGPVTRDPGARRALHRFAADLLARRGEVRCLRERLGELDLPRIVLAGGGDPYRPHQATEALAEELGVEPLIVSGAAHLTTLERPRESADALLGLIREAETPAQEEEAVPAEEEAAAAEAQEGAGDETS